MCIRFLYFALIFLSLVSKDKVIFHDKITRIDHYSYMMLSFSLGELEHTLNITQPFVIFTSSYSSDKLQKLKKKCKSIKYVIHIDDKSSSRDDLSYKTLLGRKGKTKYTQPKVTGENTTIILFSSGSTGLPKGVMLSNKSIVFLLELVR